MAKIKKIYYNGILTYPLTITDAIVDPKTTKTLSVRLEELTISAITSEEINELMTNGSASDSSEEGSTDSGAGA